MFLETSANLTECKQRVKNGKRITLTNTLLLGRNLTELLNITCSVHSLGMILWRAANKSLHIYLIHQTFNLNA